MADPHHVLLDIPFTRRFTRHEIRDAAGRAVWSTRSITDVFEWLAAHEIEETVCHTQHGSFRVRIVPEPQPEGTDPWLRQPLRS